MGILSKAKKIVSPILNYFTNLNPFVALGITLFLSWILRPKVPEMPDFGTNQFDDFERGLLINKPLSKSSNELVPKSSISGTFGLNIQDKNKLIPNATKGFILNTFVTTLVTALLIGFGINFFQPIMLYPT